MPIPPVMPAAVRLQLHGAVEPGAIVSTDREYLAGLIHHVALEYDANAAGGTTNEYGIREEQWMPIHGLDDVPCLITIKLPKNVQIGERITPQMTWKVQFGRSLVLDTKNRLVWLDPEDGSSRYGYVQGRLVNVMNHHWRCICIENPPV